MTIKKFDYSKSTEDIFYKVIYPIYAKEFLYGNNYENFTFIVSANFILNAPQWEYILEHWEQKESILTYETKGPDQEIKKWIKEKSLKITYDRKYVYFKTFAVNLKEANKFNSFEDLLKSKLK